MTSEVAKTIATCAIWLAVACILTFGGVFRLTGNRSPGESFAGVKNKLEYERLETARFVKRHRITSFRRNPFFPVNTLTIMRGAVAAQTLGVFERYVDEIYRHMWSEPKKLDDPAVWRSALLTSGFDAARFLRPASAREDRRARAARVRSSR